MKCRFQKSWALDVFTHLETTIKWHENSQISPMLSIPPRALPASFIFTTFTKNGSDMNFLVTAPSQHLVKVQLGKKKKKKEAFWDCINFNTILKKENTEIKDWSQPQLTCYHNKAHCHRSCSHEQCWEPQWWMLCLTAMKYMEISTLTPTDSHLIATKHSQGYETWGIK